MSESIYIVDDEGDLAEILTMHLQDLGYSCQWENDSRVALAEITRIKPDLLITDLQMPFVSGNEIIQKLREGAPDTPVIVMSGFAQKSEFDPEPLSRVKVLEKPFDLSQMVRIVEAFLR